MRGKKTGQAMQKTVHCPQNLDGECTGTNAIVVDKDAEIIGRKPYRRSERHTRFEHWYTLVCPECGQEYSIQFAEPIDLQ